MESCVKYNGEINNGLNDFDRANNRDVRSQHILHAPETREDADPQIFGEAEEDSFLKRATLRFNGPDNVADASVARAENPKDSQTPLASTVSRSKDNGDAFESSLETKPSNIHESASAHDVSENESDIFLQAEQKHFEESGSKIRAEARAELASAQNSPKRPSSLFRNELLNPQHPDSVVPKKQNGSLGSPSKIKNPKGQLYADGSSCTNKKSAEKLTTNGKSPKDDKQVHHVQFNKDSKQCSEKPHPSPSASISTSNSSSTDDNSSLAQFSEARPPDGGWGWVVVAASFMVNLIADGVTFSFGVMYVEFLTYFGEGRSKTSWIGSLFMAIPLLSGPVASFLTDRYGCRRVTIAGSILATTGFVISAFANSMALLIFTFGVIAGFGLSLCYVAAVVIVAYYFDKKRSFATGLSVCGSGIGTFIFAPLIRYLLDEYGWRGATLILASLFLNLAVCGCLMRDLEWTTTRAKAKTEERRKNRERKRSKIQSSSGDSFSATSSANTNTQMPHDFKRNFTSASTVGMAIENARDEATRSVKFSSLVSLPTFVKNGEKVPLEVLELLSTHKNVYNVLLQNYPSLLISSRSFSDAGRLHEQMNVPSSARFVVTKNPPIVPQEVQPMAEKDEIREAAESSRGDQARVTDGRSSKATVDNSNELKNSQQTPEDEAYLWWLKKTQNDCPLQRGGAIDHSRRLPTAYFKDIRVHRHSLTYRGAMLNINRYRLRASSCPNIYRNSMTTIAKTKMVWYSGLWEFWDLIVDMLDFSHFADLRYLLFAISNFLLYTWYDVPYVYLTDNAIKVGATEQEASYLISVIGIVNMIGEIILGWAGDRAWVNPLLVYAVCMGLCGAVTALIPLVIRNYYGLCAIAGSFGLFIAANYSLTSIILVELITLERFTNAYGLLLLVQGIANLVGPPLAGWLYDITGKYDLSFYLAGLFIALSGVLLVIMPSIEKYRKWKNDGWDRVEANVQNKHFDQMNSV